MKYLKRVLIFSVLLVIGFGCDSDKSTNPEIPGGYKGYIYYSDAREIMRLDLSDMTVEKLISNAENPDITGNNRILAVETFPIEKLIYTDINGGNIRTLIVNERDIDGPKYKFAFGSPRISYNQAYVAYEGDEVSNPITYVIDAVDGSLVATIGDWDSKQPMILPTWAPDGTLFVQGWKSMNNGIYRVSADFTSIERIDPNLPDVSSPSVSPDGKKIAFISVGKIWTMDLDGSNPLKFDTEISTFNKPTWSPDSKYIVAQRYGDFYILDIAANKITQIADNPPSDGNQLCWRY